MHFAMCIGLFDWLQLHIYSILLHFFNLVNTNFCLYITLFPATETCQHVEFMMTWWLLVLFNLADFYLYLIIYFRLILSEVVLILGFFSLIQISETLIFIHDFLWYMLMKTYKFEPIFVNAYITINKWSSVLFVF